MTHSNEPPAPRDRRDSSSSAPAALAPPLSVGEAIEHERNELLQIQAMLKCLYEVLLYADDDDSVMHADVANVCARLIADCVTRLDAVRLRTLGLTPYDSEQLPAEPPQVRENRAVYLC